MTVNDSSGEYTARGLIRIPYGAEHEPSDPRRESWYADLVGRTVLGLTGEQHNAEVADYERRLWEAKAAGRSPSP